jgi:hypothetical protein
MGTVQQLQIRAHAFGRSAMLITHPIIIYYSIPNT